MAETQSVQSTVASDKTSEVQKDSATVKSSESRSTKLETPKPKVLEPKEHIQLLYDGLSGLKDMNSAWIDAAIKTLKAYPDLVKQMIHDKKGEKLSQIPPQHLDDIVDGASSLNPLLLKLLIHVFKYLGNFARFFQDLYESLNKATYGHANIVIGIVLVIMVFVFIIMLLLAAYLFLRVAYYAIAYAIENTPEKDKAFSMIGKAAGTAAKTASVMSGHLNKVADNLSSCSETGTCESVIKEAGKSILTQAIFKKK